MDVRLGYGGERLRLALPEGSTVLTALDKLGHERPEVYARWCDRSGRIRASLGVFVNSEHVRYRDGLDTQLSDGDVVYVIPRIAGG
jgi:molybdopterin converting factor small subunit